MMDKSTKAITIGVVIAVVWPILAKIVSPIHVEVAVASDEKPTAVQRGADQPSYRW
jgi:hypothetical protein